MILNLISCSVDKQISEIQLTTIKSLHKEGMNVSIYRRRVNFFNRRRQSERKQKQKQKAKTKGKNKNKKQKQKCTSNLTSFDFYFNFSPRPVEVWIRFLRYSPIFAFVWGKADFHVFMQTFCLFLFDWMIKSKQNNINLQTKFFQILFKHSFIQWMPLNGITLILNLIPLIN
jgi:hypothetical protein